MLAVAKASHRFLLLLLCATCAFSQETCPILSQNEADCVQLECGGTCEEGRDISLTSFTADGCARHKCCNIIIPCGGAFPPPPPTLSAPSASVECLSLGITNEPTCDLFCNTTLGSESNFNVVGTTDASTNSDFQTDACFCKNYWNGTEYQTFQLCTVSSSRTEVKPPTIKSGDNVVQQWQIFVVLASIAIFLLVVSVAVLYYMSRQALRRKEALAENLLIQKRVSVANSLLKTQSIRRFQDRTNSLATRLRSALEFLSPVREGGTPDPAQPTPEPQGGANSASVVHSVSAPPSDSGDNDEAGPSGVKKQSSSFVQRLDDAVTPRGGAASQTITPRDTVTPRGKVNQYGDLAEELKAKLAGRRRAQREAELAQMQGQV
uniref:Transmembrane protein n=1 Tax=Pyramimonas obovata TaxID=1411642 RepID=A0A7S0MR16_9CHLO|mmetsp:Transcript_11408/g.23855  ORF Transcript_11408/g.23855 Transcript_11408/m.23855 type:complete len:378 (+) Transcript_11408:134-1267(+)